MDQHEQRQVLPMHKLHKVAQRYRLQAKTQRDLEARADLVALAEDYEERIIQHLASMAG
jgi:Holliday junction resolvase-like predicted endonuclease